MSLRARSLAGCLITLCLCAWGCGGAPPVVPSEDPNQSLDAGKSRFEGSAVVSSTARGNVLLFLFNAARPPPPAGVGRPLAFTFIPEAQIFGGVAPGTQGLFVAPFTFSQVPPGSYVIQGFIDHDGCIPATQGCRPPDFIPWFSITSVPDLGDVGGGLVDANTGQLQTVTLGPDLQPVVGLTVSYSDVATVPMDPPVFTVVGDSTFNLGAGDKVVELDPAEVSTNVTTYTPGLPVSGGIAPGIVVQYDSVVNGVAQDTNHDGLPDFFPKVIVRKVNDADALHDENVDLLGRPLATPAVTYAHVNPALDGQAAQVILEASFDPADVSAALSDANGNALETPSIVPKLHLLLRPVALDALDPTQPALLQSVPSGLYAIYLVERTGQVWRLPNELSPTFAPPAGFSAVPSQGFLITVP